MYRRLLRSVSFIGMALCLASAAWAQLPYPIPPDPLGSNPPVFQTIGMLDTTASLLDEADCRVCHSSGVPDRHHLLYGKTIKSGTVVPYPGGTAYTCTSCHGTTFSLVRDCLVCHKTSPHHTTAAAVARHCKSCHGSLVNDFDDGHYIPTYAASLVTPKANLTDAGWNDEAHTSPWLTSDGSGTVKDTDVLVLDTGVQIAFGQTVTRKDPAELRFRPAGYNNDFMIDEPNRGTNTYNVIFQQGSALAAAWTAGSNTLTVTMAPTQTAAELVAKITAAVTATTGARVRAGLLYDGEDPVLDRLAATAYSPLGGLPHNNRGFGAGACNYCHDDDGATDINGDPAPLLIFNNHDNHHGINLPTNISNGAGGTFAKCNACHDYQNGAGSYHDVGGPAFNLHIRNCEGCHGPQSLHNIQADSNGGGVVVGGELKGYGHVGRDAGPGDSDCWGCHGFPTAAASAPFSGPVIPTLYNADVTSMPAGKPTTLILTGAAFTNTTNGTDYKSDVRLTDADGSSVVLTPDAIADQGSLVVTIPGDTLPGSYKLQATKADVESNPAVVSIVPQVKITRATSTSKGKTVTATITGGGFGGYATGSVTSVTGTSTRANTKPLTGTVVSWNNGKIVATFSSQPAKVTVNSVFGSTTATVSRK